MGSLGVEGVFVEVLDFDEGQEVEFGVESDPLEVLIEDVLVSLSSLLVSLLLQLPLLHRLEVEVLDSRLFPKGHHVLLLLQVDLTLLGKLELLLLYKGSFVHHPVLEVVTEPFLAKENIVEVFPNVEEVLVLLSQALQQLPEVLIVEMQSFFDVVSE